MKTKSPKSHLIVTERKILGFRSLLFEAFAGKRKLLFPSTWRWQGALLFLSEYDKQPANNIKR